MKRTLIIFILLICLLPCFAVAADEGKPLFAVKDENGLWGYIDCKGNLVIPGTFTWAEDFRGEYALACQYPEGFVKSDDSFGEYELPDGRSMPSNGFYGIIDIDGQWVVAPEYEEVYSSDEGANYAGGRDTGVYLFLGKTDNKWKFGFFDIPSGYFSGLIYDYVETDFESELELDPKLIGVEMDGKLGYADRKTGEIIITCKYSPYGTKDLMANTAWLNCPNHMAMTTY